MIDPILLTGALGHMQFVIAKRKPPIPFLLPILDMKTWDKANPIKISNIIIVPPSKGDTARMSPFAIILGTFTNLTIYRAILQE